MTLGQRIKELRQQKHISQEKLGNILHVSKVSISGYENDTREPSAESIRAIANYFNVTTDYLLGVHQTPIWANDKDRNDLAAFLSQNEGSMTFEGDDLTEEEKAQLQVAMETIFWKRHKHRRKVN